VCWSSGKDSAWALETIRREGRFEVSGLLTTLTEGYGRVSMHGVREAMLDLQASRAGLACTKVWIPPGCVNEEYERAMGVALARAHAEGVTHVAFGDLFLEEVRRYREERLAPAGLEPLFPLWGRDTRALASEMLEAGLSARLVCVDTRKLPPSFAGRRFDAALLGDLPAGIDPCGENGEFHTCVTEGPMFDEPIAVRPGPTLERDGFIFADLLPAEGVSGGVQ
jgi:uncharacterized protein (TIGR00290 family)